MIIARRVDVYGFVSYKMKTYFVGEEFALTEINLCTNPSCLGHMCSETDDMSRIVNSESDQFPIKETSKKVGIQNTILPIFCRNVLGDKSEKATPLFHKEGQGEIL